jgi:hypothetical protein
LVAALSRDALLRGGSAFVSLY